MSKMKKTSKINNQCFYIKNWKKKSKLTYTKKENIWDSWVA